MKTKLLLLLFLFTAFVSVEARTVILYGNGEEISKVQQLPDTDDYSFQASDGNYYHADLGVMCNEFSLFYVPIWNYGDYKYVFFIDQKIGEYDMTYFELDEDEIKALTKEYDLPETPTLPFWKRFGGKLLVLALIGAAVVWQFAFGKKDEEEEEEENKAE